jgi:hypothetical protein
MKRFELPLHVWPVELRAAQQMLLQFAGLNSSEPIEGLRSSVTDGSTLARHY